MLPSDDFPKNCYFVIFLCFSLLTSSPTNYPPRASLSGFTFSPAVLYDSSLLRPVRLFVPLQDLLFSPFSFSVIRLEPTERTNSELSQQWPPHLPIALREPSPFSPLLLNLVTKNPPQKTKRKRKRRRLCTLSATPSRWRTTA